MIVYTLFFLILICAFFSVFKRKYSKTVVVSLFFLMLILYVLSFIRWETGTDWDSYYQIFKDSKSLNSDYYIEPVFFYINHICYKLSGSYTFLLFVLATIIFYSSYNCFKYVEYPLITYFIFYSATFGNIMFVRQSVAVSIILFSYIYIQRQQRSRFYFCILGACLIHTSSIVAFPLYYIYHTEIKWKYIIIFLLSCFIIGYYTIDNNLWLRTLPIGEQYLLSKINGYLDSAESGANMAYLSMSSSKAITNHIIKRGILIFLILLYYNCGLFKDNKFKGYLRIYLYSSCIYLFTAPISLDLSRLCTGIEMVDIFLYPYFLCHVYKPSNKVLIFVCILIFSGAKFFSNISRFPDIYTSYKTIFQ